MLLELICELPSLSFRFFDATTHIRENERASPQPNEQYRDYPERNAAREAHLASNQTCIMCQSAL
jgi:hypothetical protein